MYSFPLYYYDCHEQNQSFWRPGYTRSLFNPIFPKILNITRNFEEIFHYFQETIFNFVLKETPKIKRQINF